MIEIDGSQHNDFDIKIYDTSRTGYLNSLDILVLRFWNNEIMTNIDKVLEVIYVQLHN